MKEHVCTKYFITFFLFYPVHVWFKTDWHLPVVSKPLFAKSPQTIEKSKQFRCHLNCLLFLEAPPRFELGRKGFADLCLTTWLWCRIQFFKKLGRLRFIKRPMERITRLELATSTLARWRSTR